MNPGLAHNRSFLSLSGAQFLGHLNDNMFKMVVSLIAVEVARAQAGFYVSLTSALLVLPYLIFSGYAGHLADIASKRAVMNLCKAAEIIIMVVGLILLAGSGSLEGLLIVLFLMAAHETFFSPSKYGSVPEIVAPCDIAPANGILEASRYAAVIIGTAAGGILMDLWGEERRLIGLVAIAIAVGGLILTLRIKRLAPANAAQPWPKHPWSTLPEGLRRLGASRTLAVAVACIVFFETTAALVMLNALMMVKLEFDASDTASGGICGFAAVGCGVGALLCGRISGSKIELGIAPVAGFGLALVLLALAAAADDYATLAGGLFALGLFGGLFFLPFLAWMQKSTRPEEKGLILSTNNLLSMVGVLSASIALGLLHDVLGLTPKAIFAVTGAVATLYVASVVAICPELRCRLVAFAGAGARAISF